MNKSKQNPKVSVIIRCFNQADFIDQAIKSVRSQTYKNLEIIIIDDNSSDNSVDIIKKYAKNDTIIKLILNKQNLGGGQGRGGAGQVLNQGLDIATGKYIAVLDGDDFWLSNEKISKQVKFLEKNKSFVLVGGNVQNFNLLGKPLDKFELPKTDQALRSQIMLSNPFAASSVMFPKAVAKKVKGYPETPPRAVDLGMWLKLGTHGKMYNIQEYWHGHRMTGVNIGEMNRHKQLDDALYHITLHCKNYPNFYKAWFKHQVLRLAFRLPSPVISFIRRIKSLIN
jgi:glycosyltransferase involved in cell wall biosynthesis